MRGVRASVAYDKMRPKPYHRLPISNNAIAMMIKNVLGSGRAETVCDRLVVLGLLARSRVLA